MPEVGKVYTGQVRRVEAYGAFVEIMPGTDGLVHISEMAPYHVRDIAEVVHEGDEMTVKVINIDEVGKVRLSRKAVIMEAPDYDPAQYEGMARAPPPASATAAATAAATAVAAAAIAAAGAAAAAIAAAGAAAVGDSVTPRRRRLSKQAPGLLDGVTPEGGGVVATLRPVASAPARRRP